MKLITNYQQFESLQQAEKILKDNEIDKSRFEKLFQEFQSNGLTPYLGFVAKLLKNANFQVEEEDFTKYLDTFKKIKNSKINFDDLPLFDNKTNTYNDIYDIKIIVDKLIQKKTIITFINNWAPSSLRKEIKSKIETEDYDYLYDSRDYQNFLYLSQDKKEMLKKGSRYKTADDWLEYLDMVFSGNKYSIDELKQSNIKIIDEDDTYLIYQPLDFASYTIPHFQFWCTMHETDFEKYLRLNMLIILNKKDKEKSFISYYSFNKISIFDYKNRNIGIEKIDEHLQAILKEYYQSS